MIEFREYVIEIPGDPIPQKRPVVTKSCTFNPQAKEKKDTAHLMYMKMLILLNGASLEDKLKADIDYEVYMTFHLEVPASTSHRKANKLISEGFHNKKPDIDNLAKFYADCGNGILWSDDSKIHTLTLKKVYSEFPLTLITVVSRGNYARL